MEAAPRNPLYPRNLGDLLRERTNRWDEAEAAYKIALDIDPADADALNGLAFLEKARRHVPRLKRCFGKPWRRCRPNGCIRVTSRTCCAKCAAMGRRRSGVHARARARFTVREALNGLALLEDVRGHTAEAEKSFRKAMEADPAQPLYPRNLGDLLREANRWDEAEATYNKALELDPQFVDAVNGLGLLAKARGHIDEAERLFRPAVTLAPAE